MAGVRPALALMTFVALAVRPSPAAAATCAIGVPLCCSSDPDCDDGDACTGVEACEVLTGTCTAGTPVVCDAPPPCMTASCNAATGKCDLTPVSDDTPCDDGNVCTEGDACHGGVCAGTPRATCNDGNPCTDDFCDPVAGCQHTDNSAGCDDDNACTANDHCAAGSCVGTPVACPAGDQCHGAGICDPGTGQCSNPPLDGTQCEDGSACTRTDRCVAGVCVGGDPVVCGVGDQCHGAGVCDPGTGLCSNPALDGTPCDDGTACTRTDRCVSGSCVGGDPVVCVAVDQCHVAGTCDPATGACSNPVVPDGRGCEDGDACTSGDRCFGGVCTSGVRLTCDDGVPCTDDVCVDGTCRFQPVDARCDTGECVLWRCLPGTPGATALGCVATPVGEGDVCTEDGIGCTQDRCLSGGCRHTPVDAACSGADVCAPAICDPGSASDATGCVPVPERAAGAECAEDGDPCTDDACAAGACFHTAVTSKETCDPVRPAYTDAVGLAVNARILWTLVAGAFPEVSAQRPPVIGTAADVASIFDATVRILAGRAPAPARATTANPPPETVAQMRAGAAFAEVRMAQKAVRRLLAQLDTARQRVLLARATARDLRRRSRDLLHHTTTLRRELKQLLVVTRTFAR